MKHRIEAECSSCGGTGVYCGFMEPKGTGVICLDCDGTGKQIISYIPFERKKGKNGVNVMFHGQNSIDRLNTNANGDLSITLKSECLSLQAKRAQTVGTSRKCL